MQVRNEFYKDAQGAILVYDVNHRSSFDCLSEWLVEMRSHLPRASDIDDVIFVVCANKVKKPFQIIAFQILIYSRYLIDWYMFSD